MRPISSVDEGVHIEIGTVAVFLHRLFHAQLVVVYRCLEQAFIEFSLAELCHFAQHQVLHFIQCLACLRETFHQEHAMIGQSVHECTGIEHLLLLVQVQVHQTCLAVIENAGEQIHGFRILVRRFRSTPCQGYELGFQSPNFTQNWSLDRCFFLHFQYRQFRIRLHASKVFLDHRHHFIRLEIARKADGHVVRHIPLVVVVLDIDDGRILEVFLRTESGLCTIRMVREQRACDRFKQLASVLCRVHVAFFVYGFQLGVESADYQTLETVCLNLRPVFNLVAWDVFHIASHIITGIGIGSFGTDSPHQLVVFIRNEISGRFVGKAVYHAVNGLAFSLIGSLAIHFELFFDGIEKRFFHFVVHGSILLGTLEHEVFQVMRQTGSFGRVVLATYTNGNISLNARSFLVDGHIDLQTVVQCVDLGVQRVIRHSGIVVLAPCTGNKRHTTYRHQQQAQEFNFSFHCSDTFMIKKRDLFIKCL